MHLLLAAMNSLPGILFNEKTQTMKQWVDKLPWSYCHVGVEIALDHTHSPLSCFHNLEAHLHLLHGYHGRGQRFHLSSRRDPALVNKSCDFLKEEYLVPPFWKQDANKGLIQNSEGRWVQPEKSESSTNRIWITMTRINRPAFSAAVLGLPSSQ